LRVLTADCAPNRSTVGDFVSSGNRLKVLESAKQSGKDTEMSREKQGDGL